MSLRTVASLCALCLAMRASAVRPTTAETKAFAAWTGAAFGWSKGGARDRSGSGLLAAASRSPFSLTVDGARFPEGAGQGWQRSVRTKKLPGGTVESAIRWSQAGTGLEVTCRVWRYANFPAAEWRLEFENRGSFRSPLIEDVRSLDLSTGALGGPAALVHAWGDTASVEAFAPARSELDDGASVQLGPDTGKSSDRDMPFFDLATPTEGLLVGVGWSGSWSATVERKGGHAALSAGMRATRFRLEPGEKVRMPSILLMYHRGSDSQRGTNLLRSFLLAHVLPRENGKLVMPPICATTQTVASDGSYEGGHLRPLPSLSKWGFEALWSDMDPQHWYAGGFNGGTGNWEVDPVKYPNGLGPIGRAAHANGMDYLLWFEVERAAPGTELFVQHPEWLIKGPWADGHALVRLMDPEVRKGMRERIGRRIAEGGVDWVRLDMNIERPSSFWAAVDAYHAQNGRERTGLAEARYVEGLYAFLDDLKKAYPRLRFDLCAAGGRRIDLETLRRGIPLWITDMDVHGPNPTAQALHNGGLSRWIPLFGMPMHGRAVSIDFCAALTAGNLYANFSPEPLMASTPADQATLIDTVKLSKALRPYFLGDFYELLPHRAGADWYGYQFHREDLGRGMAVVFHPAAGAPSATLALQGIDPKKSYTVVWHGGKRQARLKGSELAALAFEFPVGEAEIVEYSIS
jgi:alpha-galactosidase